MSSIAVFYEQIYNLDPTSPEKAMADIARLPEGRLDQLIAEAEKHSDKPFRQRWRKEVEDICMDAYLCQLLGVEYCTLPERDMKRVKVGALYFLRPTQT